VFVDHGVVTSEDSESVGSIIWICLFFVKFNCEIFVGLDDGWVVGLEDWFLCVVQGGECSCSYNDGDTGCN